MSHVTCACLHPRSADAVQRHAGEQLLGARVTHVRHGELHQERGRDAGQAHAVVQPVRDACSFCNTVAVGSLGPYLVLVALRVAVGWAQILVPVVACTPTNAFLSPDAGLVLGCCWLGL